MLVKVAVEELLTHLIPETNASREFPVLVKVAVEELLTYLISEANAGREFPVLVKVAVGTPNLPYL